jgi:DNA gyrase subunit A
VGGDVDETNGEDDSEEADEDEEIQELGEGPILMTITENGFGKRAYAEKYRLTRRGSAGVINIRKDQIEETGRVVNLMLEVPDSEILLVSRSGMVIRTTSSCIRLVNRVAKGVIVMRLNEDDIVQAVARIESIDTDEENGDSAECEIPEENEENSDE